MALVDDGAVSENDGKRFELPLQPKSWVQHFLISCMIELPCRMNFSTVDVRACDGRTVMNRIPFYFSLPW